MKFIIKNTMGIRIHILLISKQSYSNYFILYGIGMLFYKKYFNVLFNSKISYQLYLYPIKIWVSVIEDVWKTKCKGLMCE